MTPIQQYDRLYHFIHTNIDMDYVYLDMPSYLNVGDILITLGIFEVLKSIPYKCLRFASNAPFVDYNIPEDCIILMQGGGNFGDLYPGANWYRNFIINKYPNNKIIILPVTVTYNNDDLLLYDVHKMSEHKKLTICVRDTESYITLTKRLQLNKIVLLPDCAFGLSKLLLGKPKSGGGHFIYVEKRQRVARYS